MMQYFTQDNTEGFTDANLALMNRAMIILLDGSTDEDDIKNACDKVSNIFDFNGRGLLTRHQAVTGVGDWAVSAVNRENCKPSHRVIDGMVEFTASVFADNEDGDEVVLTAHYYQTEQAVKDCDELDELDWKVAGYSIT